MSRSFIFESQPKSEIHLGQTCGRGSETPTSRLAIVVLRCALVEGEPDTEVQVWLSVEEFVELVKQFFWEVISPKNIYMKFLQRLLHRRWQMMTSETAKVRWLDPDNRPWMPQYDRLEV